MCLTKRVSAKNKIEAEKLLKPLIAKKDIKVYKALSMDGCSPYQYKKYLRGKTVVENKPFLRFNKVPQIMGCDGEYQAFIDTGLHSCLTKVAARRHSTRVVTMYIPKGAEYIVGERNEVVSNKLMWK